MLSNLRLPPFLGCLLVVAAGSPLTAQTWAPPAGIPSPPFGITQVAPAPPSPWTSPTAGFYYVDQTASGATDTSNPYGTPAKARQTIPTSLPAGAVVEVHGTYTTAHTSPNGIVAAGTSAQPVYIRGVSPSARPTITRSWEVNGSYLVMENLKFAFVDAGHGNLVLLAPITKVALRASEVSGNLNGGGVAVVTWSSSSVSDVVIYDNLIHDNGDVNATFDQDVHGIMVSDRVSNLWIVDNEISRSSGDGIQINGDATTTHHIYIGRNVSHENKQSGMWAKTASDVIFTENRVYGHRPSDSSSGQGMGFQYDPRRVWFLFNECYDNTIGINSGSSDSGGRADIYFIGNVLHHNLSAGLQLSGCRSTASKSSGTPSTPTRLVSRTDTTRSASRSRTTSSPRARRRTSRSGSTAPGRRRTCGTVSSTPRSGSSGTTSRETSPACRASASARGARPAVPCS